MRRFLLAGLLCALQVAADTYPRQPGIDAQHYIFRLTLSDDRSRVKLLSSFDLLRMVLRKSRSIW